MRPPHAPFARARALALVALLSALAAPAAAQTAVVFPKFGGVPGYQVYRAAGLSPGAVFASANPAVALPRAFRAHVKKLGGLQYVHPLAPGKYTVVLGFAEFTRTACLKAKRVFYADVNGKKTPPIDVFAAVGCNAPYTVAVAGVVVGPAGLKIKLVPVAGFAPFLANFKATKKGSGSTPTSPAPAPGPKPKPALPGPPSAPPAKGATVLAIDVGGGSDRPSAIVGSSTVFSNVVHIAGTSSNAKFSKNRFGKDFTYVLSVPPQVVYSVTLFLAEAYNGACKKGFRVFDITVYDHKKGPAKGKKISNVDVFAAVGCRKAYTLTINNVYIGGRGKIALNFHATSNNAMISAFEIITKDPDFSAAPSPSPVNAPKQKAVLLNLGVNDTPPPGTKRASTTKAVSGTSHAPPQYYKSGRYGSDFTYKFHLKPGAYDIILGFVEFFDPKFCSEPGKRVFNVYVNGAIQLEGYDIYAAAGCFSGVEVKLGRQSVSAVSKKPLTIRFASVVNLAQVNFISIKKAKEECVPASLTGGLADGEDHAAHAVPGTYPPQLNAASPKSYVDSDGDGFVKVQINGAGSHSHFFDSAKNIIGVITDYTWTVVETGKVLSTQEKFSYKFPLGTTRLRLSVIDNSCTTDEAETTVTVTAAIQPGQYCYYYAGLSETLMGGTLLQKPRPQYSAVSTTASLGFPSSFGFADTLFTARCFFFLEVDKDNAKAKVSIGTLGSGVARLYKGEDLIIDTTASTLAETSLAVGLIGFEVIFRRTTLSKPATLNFKVNGKTPGSNKLFYDRRTVVPILSSLSPEEGPNAGGTKVKVTGFGLFQPLKVKFGGQKVKVLSGSNNKQFFVTSPSVTKGSVVNVYATTAAGLESNRVSFAYGSTCDSVGFKETLMKTNKGKDVDFLELPTCATIGQDGKIYMGTLGATVQVLGYDADSLTTTSHCYSKPLTYSEYKLKGVPAIRDYLGITFDPRDSQMRPYLSSSTLFWHDKNRIDASNKAAWRNGAIDRLKPGTSKKDSGVCLVYDKKIVSGIPVSNHDHSVNALLFTQGGNILIAVGGFTNMGLPGYKLGNHWETHLSAAILEVKLSKAGFNGNIKYSNDLNPRIAKKISGDVDLYAKGLRNAFAMTMTRKGQVYASDQGPNCGFGDTATTCNDYDAKRAAKYDPEKDVNWLGKVNHGWKSCPATSISRPDKVVHITKGGWYGHPNVQRGGAECAWIDPFDHKTADDKPAPGIYKKPLVTLKSSVTGVSEYTANHFCGKLRGELILSTYKGGTTYRMGVDGSKVKSGPDELSSTGGITFVVNAHGDMIFPRLTKTNVFVLRPKSNHAGLFVANAIPFRHGKNGGTKIVIGGKNFGMKPTVKIGNAGCKVVKASASEITCTVPKGSGLQTLTVTSAGKSSTLKSAVLYMNV